MVDHAEWERRISERQEEFRRLARESSSAPPADAGPVNVDPPPDGGGRAWWLRPIDWWRVASWRGRLVTVVVVILLAGLIGAMTGLQDEVDELEAANAELEADLAEAEEGRTEAEVSAAEADERALDTEAAAEREIEDMQDEVAQERAVLRSRRSELDRREREIEREADALAQLTAAVEANSFGDGLYQVGTDLQPGLYRTDGGFGCYWAKLNSSNTSDFIDNHFGDGPQTVEISTGWFESAGCGTWRRG